MPYNWNECVIEGNKSFDYMIHNFDKMFDGTTIKHFDIRYATSDCMIYYDDIKVKYLDEIQSDLIQWIKEEHGTRRLQDLSNWKPFRDTFDFLDIYLGYNKLFLYKGYYFQLALEHRCEECKYCVESNLIHFELALYGWGNEMIEPDKRYTVENGMVCKSFWDRK
jgi:hypothetical protein